jgi:hypothetical protein
MQSCFELSQLNSSWLRFSQRNVLKGYFSKTGFKKRLNSIAFCYTCVECRGALMAVPELPDLSWSKHNKTWKIYQITTNCTKWPSNTLSGRNIFHSKTLQSIPEFGFIGMKINHLATMCGVGRHNDERDMFTFGQRDTGRCGNCHICMTWIGGAIQW